MSSGDALSGLEALLEQESSTRQEIAGALAEARKSLEDELRWARGDLYDDGYADGLAEGRAEAAEGRTP